jgi:hypothetical protein
MIDPTAFLSTLVAASAALVAIVGGLLVARFVTLDSDQQGTLKVLRDAEERLAAARQRAGDAEARVLRRDAQRFLNASSVREAIADEGQQDLPALRTRADCALDDDAITPFLQELPAELALATAAVDSIDIPPARTAADVDEPWEATKRTLPGYTDAKWPRYWEHLFEKKALARGAHVKREQERRREQRPAPALLFAQPYTPEFPARQRISTRHLSGESRETAARRDDALVAERERARQQVEDLRAEVARLERDHARVVRPDVSLWAGAVVLIYFTAVGLALPTWRMSRVSPVTTCDTRLLFRLFASALGALILYILLYLARLTTGSKQVRAGQRRTVGTRRARPEKDPRT